MTASLGAPETVVACLTAPGRSALATLGLHGPGAWEAVRRLVRLRSGAAWPDTPEPGRFWLGRAGVEMADDVVLAVKRARPEPWLELHSHGGREVVRYLLDLLREEGLRVCDWPEFLRRAEGDSLRTAAELALTAAPTVRTAAILLDQVQGALEHALVDVLAALGRGDRTAADAGLDALVGRCSLGRHLTAPWRVVVAGPPNVGKSSLVNVLAGYQRSIVASTPGTTRDVVTARIAVDGWPVELADTAGLRSGTEALEGQGIDQARAAAATADLCLWVLDASAAPMGPDAAVGALLSVVNKIDLAPAWDLAEAGDALRVSARTGAGLPDLLAALARRLVPEPPPAGAGVPFTAALCDAITETRRLLRADQAKEAGAVLEGLRQRLVVQPPGDG